MKTVFATGGAGYVGSHCCKAFAQAGWKVVVFDNLSRGWRDAVKWGPLVEGDITDAAAMAMALEKHRPDVVVHFAAFSYVAESVARPDLYYRNNVVGSQVLLDAMRRTGVRNIVFSSSCATYGQPRAGLIDEEHPQSPINPYGWSKLFVERMLRDYAEAYGLNAAMLRYFNAAGCHPDGDIGERHEPETHLIPLAIEAALADKRLSTKHARGESGFTVNGNDFDTSDGTAVRDYVHVLDLARGHLLAADLLLGEGGVHAINLGTGRGASVLEITRAVAKAVGRDDFPLTIGPRRRGDPASLVASAAKAQQVLGWTPEHSDIGFIVSTALAWAQRRIADRAA